MGMHIGFSRCSAGCNCASCSPRSDSDSGDILNMHRDSKPKHVVERYQQQGNPNPRNFTIQMIRQIGDHSVVMINYHDCHNYEGKKILIFKATENRIRVMNSIDPHFCDSVYHLSPIARFVPTVDGWNMACAFVRNVL